MYFNIIYCKKLTTSSLENISKTGSKYKIISIKVNTNKMSTNLLI